MALVLADRVKETTTTTGTGTVTLAGASSGFQSFAAVGNANTTYYCIAAQTGTEWEVGIGTYTSVGTTLARNTVLASSNAGSLVTFSAGTKDVFVTYPSSRSIYADGTTLTATNSSILPATSGGTSFASYAVGDILYASTTTALSKLADVATGSAIISGGVGVAPSYGKIGLTTHVSGVLPVANGGTNASAAGITAFNNITGYTAAGATGTTSTNLVFSTSPTLVTPLLGTPTSGVLTNCTGYTAGNISGTINLTTQVTGTLPIANGGTNSTATATAGGIGYGTGTAHAYTAAGTSGQVVTSAGAGVPTWTTATNANTASAIVQRDASGNFSAGTITASLTGNASGSAATFTSTSQNSQFNSIGVGTAGSGTAGEIRATNAVTAYYSDDRLKTKLGNIEGALAKVKTLSGFYYEANETAQALGYKPKREVGVSAQSVQAVLPEVVVPAPIDEQYLTVHYDKLVPLLIEAIKELEAKVALLEAKG